MKICISNKSKDVVKAIILVLGLWFLLSIFNSPHVIPPIKSVVLKLIEIFTSLEMLKNIGITFVRLFIAMTISILLALTVGILAAMIKPLKDIIREMLKIFQVVPPVSVLIMAIMWFGLNGTPAIFIVIFSLIPLISIQVIDAIDNIDNKLLEMARVFKFSKLDLIFKFYIPAIRAQIWTAITVGVTMGSKVLVMGEVMTTSTGIGGRITTARLNLEPESVIAWTIVMLCLYYILENLLGIIKKRTIIQ